MTGRRGFACWRSGRRDAGEEGKEEEEGVNEGEFECVRQTWTEATVRLMVLERRQKRGGTGGGIETQREGERRRNGKVESWSAAVVPLDQTMMGLYYPAMLPVSSLP